MLFVVMLCSGCVGCCDCCLICDACSWRCSFIGSMCVDIVCLCLLCTQLLF